MTSELHPEAENELADAAEWYGNRSIFAGERFLEEFQDAVRQVTQDPGRYQTVGRSVRVFRLRRFPYKLLYEYDEAGRTSGSSP